MSELTDGLKGLGTKLKGGAKKAIGNATNNPKLQAEGKLDKLKGEAQQALSDVKETLSNKLDDSGK